ncbi:Glypican-5 Secreted glypican-5 [Takifugu flavidus]|uniref:Glypican-5 Secreted glypican-5 n=1 Tax=Takifugu flavidus TaxID=433684 RepID=A0A5C6MV64_9TELE|nr:Glypican-5 Secreted glypican-5 [Takifugu flavidus]
MVRAALQNADLFWLIWFYIVFVAESGCRSADVSSCHEVKTAYLLRQIGPVKLVPDRPGAGESLRVCVHPGPSCCTSKMEDSYMAAVRSETQQKMRSYSFELKYLIAGHTKAYQGDPVSSLDNAVHRFYDDLFPLVYQRLLNPGMGHPSPQLSSFHSGTHKHCLRTMRQEVGPFGPHPRLLLSSLSRVLGVGRALSQLLKLAGEVVNATERLTLSRECGRGLVRMQYCSHCRGLTLIRPCTGLCVNIMRGCLMGVSDLGAPWKSLVVLLQRLAATLATSSNHNSMELALLAARNHVNDAILHAQLHGPHITATAEKVCGPQSSHPALSHAPASSTTSVTSERWGVTAGPAANQRLQDRSNRSFLLKGSQGDKSRSLKKLSREFEGSIQRYQWFFSELPEMLCESEMEVEQHTCWNGQEVVESYAGRIGSAFENKRKNPEASVRNADPVLKGVKLRLEQLTQELLVELGWARKTRIKVEEEEEGGSAQMEGGSGYDCDDEDGCEASGENRGSLIFS